MKMIDKVMEELQRQGLVPSIEDFGIAFKYQMKTFLCFKNEDDEEYFTMYMPYVFEVDEENELEVLRAMNAINHAMKVVKLIINEHDVWVCFEEELPKNASVEDIVPFAIVTLFQACQRFYEQLKGV